MFWTILVYKQDSPSGGEVNVAIMDKKDWSTVFSVENRKTSVTFMSRVVVMFELAAFQIGVIQFAGDILIQLD